MYRAEKDYNNHYINQLRCNYYYIGNNIVIICTTDYICVDSDEMER